MPRINTTLGGGTSDAGTSFGNYGAGTDFTSAWNPTNTGMYTSGGFNADGITPSTTVVAAIEYIQLRGGGDTTSVGGGVSNATVYIELATAASGGGGYNNSTKTYTTGATTTTYSTANTDGSSVNWAINCGTTYYYGFYVTAGSRLCFARGGTTGNIYINGTASSSFTNSTLSGQVSQRSTASAPGTPTASNISHTSATLTWTQPTDDGHTLTTGAWNNANVTGWRINYKKSTDSAWTPYTGDVAGKINPSSATYNSGAGTYSYTVTGLKPGTSYDFQVAALTKASDAWNTDYSSITAVVGVRSGTLTLKTLGGVYSAGTWNPIKNVTYKVFSGSTSVSTTYSTGNPLISATLNSPGIALKSGDTIIISGASASWVNGTWTVNTVTSNTAFTFAGGTPTTTGGSTGTLSSATRDATVKVWNGTSWATYF
jgi:hypothetical protein